MEKALKLHEMAHANRRYKCQKVARLTNNGYLNWLRDFKMRYCGLFSSQNMVRFGARAWWTLSEKQKQKYKAMGVMEKRRLAALRVLQKAKRAARAAKRSKQGLGLVGILKARDHRSPRCRVKVEEPAASRPVRQEQVRHGSHYCKVDFGMITDLCSQAFRRQVAESSSVEANGAVEPDVAVQAHLSQESNVSVNANNSGEAYPRVEADVDRFVQKDARVKVNGHTVDDPSIEPGSSNSILFNLL